MKISDLIYGLHPAIDHHIEVCAALFDIDERYGDGNGHTSTIGKSWTDYTEDVPQYWLSNGYTLAAQGSLEHILGEHMRLRRDEKVRGHLAVTTDGEGYCLWLPASLNRT